MPSVGAVGPSAPTSQTTNMLWIFNSLSAKLSGNRWKIPVNNFGEVVENRIYRSALPSHKALVKAQEVHKIKQVLDLRVLTESEFYARRRMVEGLGLKYINIPMDEYHEIPQELVRKAVDIIAASTEDNRILVHCKGGIHRTGLAILAYRIWHMFYTWDDAYKEAKKYHFYKGNNHEGVLVSMKKAAGVPIK